MPIPDYNFTELFCWSDEEGGNPFRDWEANAISDLLHSKFEFSADGLLIGLKGDVAIGFLGDLLDNEAYSIRVLQAMIRLKEASPANVLLIGGNRDFNKIRMGIELFIQLPNGSLPWTGIADMPGLLARLAEPFNFRKTNPPEYLLDVLKAWTDSMPAITAAYNGSDIEARVNIMYGKTLGAPLDMMKRELNAILGAIPEELYAKLICTMQMVMSFYWDDLPEFLEPFNGLYLTYLRQCHIIASFRINGQTGIMSHAGMPDGTKNGNRLTSPFGFQVTEDMPDAMLSIILNEIEEEKNRLIETVQEFRDRNYDSATADEEINDLINKYVHMTAGADAQFPADSGVIAEASPIVGLQKVATSDRRDIEVQLGGGTFGWIGRQKGQKIKRVSSGPTTIAYNIYGHAPQGFLPTAYRHTPEGTLHVNLDVSKLEEKANALSFVFLHIDGATTEFIGRIKFPKVGRNTAGSITTYTGDATALPDTVYYYIEPIVEKDLSKERPIPGTPNIIVKYVKYDREVTTKTAGGRRKTIRRRSKRSHRSRKVRFARK
jgi:hypothetical protein